MNFYFKLIYKQQGWRGIIKYLLSYIALLPILLKFKLEHGWDAKPEFKFKKTKELEKHLQDIALEEIKHGRIT